MPLTLPVKVLRAIIQDGEFRKPDLEGISRASRLFREIALPELFRSISLRIGIDVKEKAIEDDKSIMTYFSIDLEYEAYRVEKSLQVLRGMGKEDAGGKKFPFVHLVQELQINYLGEETKHTRYVKLALKKLVNLCHFVWHGPCLPDDLANVLSRLDISLSFNLNGIDDNLCRTLRTFKKIRSIEVVPDSENYLSCEEYLTLDEAPDTFLGTLDKNRSHLKRLSLFGCTMRQCFTKGPQLFGMATNLTHLAICSLADSPSFFQFLQKASSLEFLTLLDIDTLKFLPTSPGTLPRLRYLKLAITRIIGIDHDNRFITDPDMEKVCKKLPEFVGVHRDFHGFDLSFYVTYGNDPYRFAFRRPKGDLDLDYNCKWFKYIYQAISSLKNVRALGVTFPAMKYYEMHTYLELILKKTKLRHTCTALRLGGLSNVPLGYQGTTSFRNCRFMSLSNGRPDEHYNNSSEPLHPVQDITEIVALHSKCQHLQQFQLNGTLYSIDGVCDDDMQVVATFWDEERASRKRTESDFCSFEAYWLMKYRTIMPNYESMVGLSEGD